MLNFSLFYNYLFIKPCASHACVVVIYGSNFLQFSQDTRIRTRAVSVCSKKDQKQMCHRFINPLWTLENYEESCGTVFFRLYAYILVHQLARIGVIFKYCKIFKFASPPPLLTARRFHWREIVKNILIGSRTHLILKNRR